MAKYKIIPSSMTIVRSPISIGHKAEKGVEAIEFDLTAWVEAYGLGTLTVIMRRWGDAIPYPIALEIDENNKATWTLSDIDTAKAGMAYAQLSYIVGDEVVKKSDIYTFRVMDSLTGEGDPPEAYESWLENLTHLAAEAMAEVLDIEGIVTDKRLTVDGGIADAKATGDALALKADKSTTYTKAQVDGLIEDVTVETDTTLAVSGAPADAAETGRQFGLIKADLGELQEGGYIADAQQIQAKVNTYLTQHPEATTTVLDGSLSESKFSGALKLKTIKEYVTPEMYGAVGDGVTDDTLAIQTAINTGKTVLIPEKTYKITGLSVDGGKNVVCYGSLVSTGHLFSITGTWNDISILSESFSDDEAIIFDDSESDSSIIFNRVYAKCLRCFGKYGIRMTASTNGIYSNVIDVKQLNYKYVGDTFTDDVTSNNAVFGIVLETSGSGFINENLFSKCHAQRWTSAIYMHSASNNIMNGNVFTEFSPENSAHGIYLYGESTKIIGNHFLRFRNQEVVDEHVVLKGNVDNNNFSFTAPVKAKMFTVSGSLDSGNANSILAGVFATYTGTLIWGGTTLFGIGADGNIAFWNTHHETVSGIKYTSEDITYDIFEESSKNFHQYGMLSVNANAESDVNVYLSSCYAPDKINTFRVKNNSTHSVKIHIPTAVNTNTLVATIEGGVFADVDITTANSATVTVLSTEQSVASETVSNSLGLTIKAYKRNDVKMVTIDGKNSSDFPAGSGTYLGRLSAQYYPTAEIKTYLSVTSGGIIAQLKINTNGQIYIYPQTAITANSYTLSLNKAFI